MDTARPGGATSHDDDLLDQLERNFRDARAVLTGYQAGITALIDGCTTGLNQVTELRTASRRELVDRVALESHEMGLRY